MNEITFYTNFCLVLEVSHFSCSSQFCRNSGNDINFSVVEKIGLDSISFSCKMRWFSQWRHRAWAPTVVDVLFWGQMNLVEQNITKTVLNFIKLNSVFILDPIKFQSGLNRVPIGFQSGSNRVPIGFQSGSNRVPFGFQLGSNWVPIGFQSGSVRVPIRCQSRSK